MVYCEVNGLSHPRLKSWVANVGDGTPVITIDIMDYRRKTQYEYPQFQSWGNNY